MDYISFNIYFIWINNEYRSLHLLYKISLSKTSKLDIQGVFYCGRII